MSTEFKLVASDAVTLQEFGSAVAFGGDYAIIGAPHGPAEQGAAYIFLKSGAGWTEQAKLSPSDATTFDHFGAAVAIDGDYAIVGAYQAGSSPKGGQAYIFHRVGSNWVQESILVASDKSGFANFGQSVALSGDWAIVGARNAAYVFQLTAGSTWTEQAKLTGNPSTEFGRAVSIKGDDAVVGASSGVTGGTAHVFQRSGTNWQQQAVLAAADGTKDNYFGSSVSISGDYIIVGAFKATGGGLPERGAAYIFMRSGAVWIQQQKLEATVPLTSGWFGFSVAINGNYAVVGAPLSYGVASGSGLAYLFQRNGMSWVVLEQISASDAGASDNFGRSVHIDATSRLAIVGAPNNTDALLDQGVAYVFSDSPGQIDLDRHILVARILFGLVGGGGGVIWLPGTGPKPVDPEPFKVWSTLSPIEQDLLIGRALGEMANLINDGKSRQDVKAVGLKLMKKAVSEVRVPGEAEAK